MKRTRLVIIETSKPPRWSRRTGRLVHSRPRLVARRRIRFAHDPAALIARAARLVRWSPVQLMLLFGTMFDRPTVRLFRPDERGMETTVTIVLEPSDIAMMAAYMLKHEELRMEVISGGPDVEDGGEELPLPKITVAELARLKMSRGVH